MSKKKYIVEMDSAFVDLLKNSGQLKIIKEGYAVGSTIRLTDIYDDYELNDEQEAMHSYITDEDLQKEFVVQDLSPMQAQTLKTPHGDMTVFESFKDHATKDQRSLVKHKMENFDHDRIIVVCNQTVIDGNHHLVAGIMAGHHMKFINLAD